MEPQGLSWSILLDLGDELSGTQDPPAIAETLRNHFEKNTTYQVEVWISKTFASLPGKHGLNPFPEVPGIPIMAHAWKTREITITGKGGKPTRYEAGKKVTRAAFPLRVKESCPGVMQVEKKDGGVISADEMLILDGICRHTALVIQNNHQAAIKTWRIEQLSLLRYVSQQISSGQNAADFSTAIVELIKNTFHYHAVCIALFDQVSRQFHLQATTLPISEDNTANGNSGFILPDDVLSQLIADKEVLLDDPSKKKGLAASICLSTSRSLAIMPLQFSGAFLGALIIQSQYYLAFHEMDLLVLRTLANNLALSIEGSKLYQGLQRRIDDLALLTDVGKAIASILDFDTLMEQVVDIIHDKYNYPSTHLYLIQPDTGMIVYKSGAGSRSLVLDAEGLVYPVDDKKGLLPLVASTGRTYIANDVHQEDRYRPSRVMPEDTKAEMVVPIIFGSEVLGLLDVQSDRENSFDENDRHLMETLAGAIAIAIRNAKLFSAERWRRKAADGLREVAGQLAANVDTGDFFNLILSEVEKILPATSSSIWFLEDGGYSSMGEDRKLVPEAIHGLDIQALLESLAGQKEGQNWLQKGLYGGGPLIWKDGDDLDPVSSYLGLSTGHSAITAPLRVGNQPLGVLLLVHEDEGRYGLESLQLTTAFASYAAVAIQNARLFSTAQEQAWVSTVMLQIAEATQSITSIDELVEVIVKLTPMLVGIEGFAVFLWQENLNTFSLEKYSGYRPASNYSDAGRVYPAGTYPDLFGIKNEKSSRYVDLDQISLEMADPSRDEDLLHILLPLTARGDLLGACLVSLIKDRQAAGREVMVTEQLAIIQGITHQAALAIENMRLLESEQQESYITTALLQVAQMIVSSTELADLYASIVQIIPILAGSESVMLYLFDQNSSTSKLCGQYGIRQQTIEEYHMDEIKHGFFPLLDSVRVFNQPFIFAIDESESQNLHSWMQVDEPGLLSTFEHLNTNSQLVVGIPLGVKNEVFGAILVQDSGRERAYFKKRMELLRGIGHQTALAIQNDQLQKMEVVREQLERELQIARTIQKTFLPSELPGHAGWKIDVRWRTAREVGGDFYDVFQLSDSKVVLVVADVTDKGMSAALYMTVTHTLIRTVTQQVEDPAEVLCRVNDLLLRDTPHGMFITAFLGILDWHNGTMHYTNAGHNLPIIKRRDGSLEKLNKGGMPLGIMDELTLNGHSVHLQPGDTMIMFTDGITEASTATDFFGETRLEEAILCAGSQDPVEVLDSIDSALTEFASSEIPSDDITLLAVHREERRDPG